MTVFETLHKKRGRRNQYKPPASPIKKENETIINLQILLLKTKPLIKLMTKGLVKVNYSKYGVKKRT